MGVSPLSLTGKKSLPPALREQIPGRRSKRHIRTWFLDAYAPEKRDEGAAWQAWLTLSRAKQLPGLPKLLDAVTAWENSEQWQKDNGQYIPLASNFLTKRRFLDTPPQRADPADEFDPERFAKAAEQWKNRYKTTGGA